MVVDDFDLVGMFILPPEADSVLFIDPDAMLPESIPTKTLQPIPRWNGEFGQVPNPAAVQQHSRCVPAATMNRASAS
jgi:hypothetical protein